MTPSSPPPVPGAQDGVSPPRQSPAPGRRRHRGTAWSRRPASSQAHWWGSRRCAARPGLRGSRRRLRVTTPPLPLACGWSASHRGRRTSPRRRSACASDLLVPAAGTRSATLRGGRSRKGARTTGRACRSPLRPKARLPRSSGGACDPPFRTGICERSWSLGPAFGNVP
jgi:hypothetical protein